jgi:hypothetical protein
MLEKAPIRLVVVMALAMTAGCGMPSGGEAALDEGRPAGVQEGPKTIEAEAARVATTRQDLSFTGCSQLQTYVLAYIWAQAQLLAERGYEYQKVDKNRYWAQYWFGYPSQANSRLLTAKNRLQTGNLDILCDDGPLDPDHHPSCTPNHLARAQSKMRLCEGFWNLSPEDAVLTFLHETAHFSGAPNDTAYSEQACYDLARSNPTAAAKNGANYEHYYNHFW